MEVVNNEHTRDHAPHVSSLGIVHEFHKDTDWRNEKFVCEWPHQLQSQGWRFVRRQVVKQDMAGVHQCSRNCPAARLPEVSAYHPDHDTDQQSEQQRRNDGM